MNKILIDTQILLFCLSEPKKLSDKQTKYLKSGDYAFFIHPVSFWEIQIKYDLGKLSLPDTPEFFLPPLVEKSGFQIDEFRVSSVYYLNKLPSHHKDPFDRLIIAHCLETNTDLMSSDEIFRKYPVRLID
ncbi:MAG: type II toxin-antitoxin system VapC family toxin [Leptospira sp.]|nr:type II toxin-antitoxin system VapC family toxin [Leptospira sp.]